MTGLWSWIKAQGWRVVLAYLIARFVTRVSGILFAGIDSYLTVATLALGLQGVYFGLIFQLLARGPLHPMLCLFAAVASVAINLPLALVGLSGATDPRWMLVGLPLTVLAFGTATYLLTRPRT